MRESGRSSSGGRAGVQVGEGTRPTLVEMLSRFEGPAPEFLRRLVTLQGRVTGADHGVVIRFVPQSGPAVVADYNPQPDRLPPPWVRFAAEQAEKVFASAAPLVMGIRTSGPPAAGPEGVGAVSSPAAGTGEQFLILLGLPQSVGLDGGEGRFMVALGLDGVSRGEVERAAQQVELTLGLLGAYDARAQLHQKQGGIDRLTESVDVLAELGRCRRFREAAMALCNELASRHGAERVSLGWVEPQREALKLIAMSRTERLNRRMKLVQDLESAMHECLDQDLEVVWPAPPEVPVVSRDHQALTKQHGSVFAVSLPLRHVAGPKGEVGGESEQGREGGVVAVLTLEWNELPKDASETAQRLTRLRLIGELATPLLVPLRQRDRWVGGRLKDGSTRVLGKVVGTQYTWAKLAAVGLLALVLWLTLGKGTDHVESSFVIEATQRQLVTAPFAGYLESVHVGPGDAVEAGATVLAELDTAELRLQAAELRAQETAQRKQAEAARRESDMSGVQVALAEAEATAAKRRLLERQIEMAALRSSLGGMVLEGDLKREIGKAVTEGETLFEVAPVEALRAELYIPEDRAGEVTLGMRGELATTSYPDQRVGFTVRSIEPKAKVHQGRNVFAAEVELDRQPPWLRPGMTGAARLDAGESSHLWLWTRDAVNWVRMQLWL
ncbi:MAG: HlyD family efflux transporter periplasmic adaptor subunit [Planctomycetota bacterium]